VPCATGRPALCEPGAAANGKGTLLSGERRLHFAETGDAIHHHIGVSCFADHAVVSRRSVVKIDPDVPLDQAALFGCAVLTGVGAVLNTAAVPAGSRVAVIGLGGVGLAALLAARVAGAERIVAVDVQPAKLALAKDLGATDAFDARDADCAAALRAATSGGVDFAFEMAGSQAAMKLAYDITRRGGTTVTAGLPPPSAALALPLVSLVAEERTVKGSYIGSSVPRRDVPRFLSLFRRGLLPVDRLMSGHVPLDDINVALDRLAAGEVVRQIVSFS
jgi:alcohol dehydrogenase